MKIILVVDDEVDITDTFSLLLELHGYKALHASNGREALHILETCHPDLIVSDCMMPVMDGVALCKAVKADPATKDIPFLLMSGAPDRHDLSDLNYDLFLLKPFHISKLMTAIDTLLAACRT